MTKCIDHRGLTEERALKRAFVGIPRSVRDHRCTWSSALGHSKKGSRKAPLSKSKQSKLRSVLPSRGAHHLSCMNAPRAHLHLNDFAVDDDARDLKVGLPRPTRLVVRVRD